MTEPSLIDLQACLHNELLLVRELAGLLDTESKALEQADPIEALTESTQRKNACIDRLTACVHQREQLLHLQTAGVVSPSLESLALNYPQLADLIQQLLTEGLQASSQNETNGALIHGRLRQNQGAIDFLAGLSGTRAQHLYDAKGRSSHAATHTPTRIKAG